MCARRVFTFLTLESATRKQLPVVDHLFFWFLLFLQEVGGHVGGSASNLSYSVTYSLTKL